MITLSTKNIEIYTNDSWGCNNHIDQVVVHYMTLKVGERKQIVYQETDHGPFWMRDDEECRLSILSLHFRWVRSAIIFYFIVLAIYI